MKLSDFTYTLPDELIARFPLQQRSASRLLHMDRATGKIRHHQFKDITTYLKPDDLLVFNNTKVIAARLRGHKSSGGKVEILLERMLDLHQALCMIRASKSPKPETEIQLGDGCKITVLHREGEFFRVRFPANILEILDQFGEIPLPPYLEREPDEQDVARYQTVYARHPGAVAAPTAGLHFDADLLETLQAQGVDTAFITLHVGAGTFQPVRVENITEHRMHKEYISVPQSVCDQIAQTRRRGGRVIAVGTTTVRSLETAALSGSLKPYQGDTDIFIYPGFRFKCVDGMITNFHLPESTLLMLVCAFAGYRPVINAYQEAVKERYRFYSYGDAMLLV